MQGFKKVLVALLVVMTILGTMGPVFAAPADVQGTKYEDAAVRLMALGIFKGDDKGNFNPDMPISRAEATAIIIRALGLEKSAELMKGVTKFADVNADPGLQWATGAINIAVSQGIIKGYPDGRFGGRDNVTYAQLAKMILYALNYGITVEGGVWPTAVLAKADELGMIKGLTVVADAPITRGDAAKMLDNSLNIKSLRQEGYGDLKTYKADGDTLLQKLNVDELEGQVTAIPAVDSGLKSDEVRIKYTKKNGVKLDSATTEKFTVLQGIDMASLFGLDAKVWVNSDGEVVYAQQKTSESDVIYDQVKENATATAIKLLVKDKQYDWAGSATIYVNNSPGTATDIKAGDFGKFVLKDNAVAFAHVYRWTVKGAVVKSVDGEVVKYFTTSNTEQKLRLDQAKAYNIYKDGKEISLSDIKPDDVLSWYKNSDNKYFIFVARNAVSGTLDKIRSDSITVDGETYKLGSQNGNITTVSSDADSTVKGYSTTEQMAKDLVGKDVTVLLDLNGHVRHIRGDVKASSTIYGVAVKSWVTDKYYLQLINTDGEKVTYEVTDSAATSSGGTALFSATPAVSLTNVFAVKAKLDSNGAIKEFVTVTNSTEDVTKLNKDGYLEHNGTVKYYVTDSTVFFNADQDDLKGDPPSILKWNDIKDKTGSLKAIVIKGTGDDAKLVVFTDGIETILGTSTKYAFVTDAWVGSNNNFATLDTAGDGEADKAVAGNVYVPAKGDVVEYKLTAKGEAAISGMLHFTAYNAATTSGSLTSTPVQGYVYKVDGQYLYVGSATATPVRVAGDAVVYDISDFLANSNKPVNKVDLASVNADATNGGDYVWLVLDSTGQAKVVVITKVQ